MKVPTEFGCSVDGGDPIVVTIWGEVDLSSAPKLADAIGELIQLGHLEVTLDLGAVEFMDSTGVRVLVDLFEALREAGGELLLQAASAPVRRVLALTGLDRLLALPDEETLNNERDAHLHQDRSRRQGPRRLSGQHCALLHEQLLHGSRPRRYR
jgi:anti-sigma B factor antagonist